MYDILLSLVFLVLSLDDFFVVFIYFSLYLVVIYLLFVLFWLFSVFILFYLFFIYKPIHLRNAWEFSIWSVYCVPAWPLALRTRTSHCFIACTGPDSKGWAGICKYWWYKGGSWSRPSWYSLPIAHFKLLRPLRLLIWVSWSTVFLCSQTEKSKRHS